MRKAIRYLSAKKAYLLVWMVLFVVSAISVSWRHFFFEETECMDGLVRSELGVCLAFFLLALVPLNYLRVGRGIARRLRLNHAWGVLGLACLSFAAVYFLFACRIPGAAELRMLCFLLLSLVLLCVEAENMAKRWFLPMLLLSLGSWLFAKLLLKGGNSFGMFVAVAVSIRLLSGGRPDKSLLAKLGAYLFLSLAVPVLYACFFEPERIKASIAVWRNASDNPFTWYGSIKNGDIANILLAALHLTAASTLLLITKQMNMNEKRSVRFLVALDLTLILIGVLIWFNILPQGTLAIMPFRTAGSALLSALLANHLLYYNLTPFKGLREDIARLRRKDLDE